MEKFKNVKEHHPESPLTWVWELFYAIDGAPHDEEKVFIQHCEKQK